MRAASASFSPRTAARTYSYTLPLSSGRGVPALNEGDKVSFEIEDDRRGRGKQAANVQLA